MERIAMTQTLVHIHKKMPSLTQEEQEIIARFVLRTGDMKLTNKLLEELAEPGVEQERVRQKFEVFMEEVSPLAEQLEGLLIALEQYRIQQDRTIKLLEVILLGNQAVKAAQLEEQRKKTEEKEQQEREEKEEEYVGRNPAGGTDYKSRL
jgi:hypothetical protein